MSLLIAESGGNGWLTLVIVGGVIFVFVIGIAMMLAKFYRKVGPEEALVRSGVGGLKAVTGSGCWVFPILHRYELMDLSVKRIEIARKHESGLICKDNVRADIEIAFFVRVSNKRDMILQVAQALGCRRASERQALIELFDAKFSEALKTVGKHFDFVELYDKRDAFRDEIIDNIGQDLNGYALEDFAIDYLEQTSVEKLNPQNILDAEGIKKITDLTAREHILSNDITREKEKTITKQDVEAREAILELEKQQVEAEQKQKRQIVEISARENAQGEVVREEERLKAERARIATEEDVNVAEQNKQRQILVAQRNKERTDAVEVERVEKDRELEVTERERVVTLAQIEKDKAVEVEKRNIQDVIRERVVVERAVVEEQERIKDTEEFAGADRLKRVTVTEAEMTAEQQLVKEVKAAEAAKRAADLLAEKVIVEAEAQRQAAEKDTQAQKMLAEAKSADHAAIGLADAHVMETTASAIEKHGTAEANVLQKKAVAEARGLEAKAVATEKHGTAEANVMKLKYSSEAEGLEEKANAMKVLDGVGKEHEEFKIRINKDKDVEIAAIDAQTKIAAEQSTIVGEALKSANIDIVGGDIQFFDRIVESVKGGKAVDRFVNNSGVLTDMKNTFFNGNPEYFRDKLQSLVAQFDLSTDDIKDLSIAALIGKMLGITGSSEVRGELQRLLGFAQDSGVSSNAVSSLKLSSSAATS